MTTDNRRQHETLWLFDNRVDERKRVEIYKFFSSPRLLPCLLKTFFFSTVKWGCLLEKSLATRLTHDIDTLAIRKYVWSSSKSKIIIDISTEPSVLSIPSSQFLVLNIIFECFNYSSLLIDELEPVELCARISVWLILCGFWIFLYIFHT